MEIHVQIKFTLQESRVDKKEVKRLPCLKNILKLRSGARNPQCSFIVTKNFIFPLIDFNLLCIPF